MSTRRSFLQSVLFLPSLAATQAFAQDSPAPASTPFADFAGGVGDGTRKGEAFGASPATGQGTNRGDAIAGVRGGGFCSRKQRTRAAIGLSLAAGLCGFLLRPAEAQIIAEFSNLPGVGANINHALLPDTAGSTRLSTGGSNPITALAPQRDFGLINAQQGFSLLANQTYNISVSGYFVGIKSNGNGSQFKLASSNVESLNFSFAWADETGKIVSSRAAEYRFESSEFTIQRVEQFSVIGAEPFSGGQATFDRYNIDFKFRLTADFFATKAGMNMVVVTEGVVQRVFGANFQNAPGQLLRRVGNGTQAQQFEIENALGLGISVRGQNPVIVPETSSANLALSGLLMLVAIGKGRYFRGRVKPMEPGKE